MPIDTDVVVSASHVFTTLRKFSLDVAYSIGPYKVGNDAIFVDPTTRDFCYIDAPVAEYHAATVARDLPANNQATLRGKPVELRSEEGGDLYLGWQGWICSGMSGGGIYNNDGELLAVLSRFKRGEYGVGTLVAPFLED